MAKKNETTPEENAELSKQRGRASSFISDPEQKKKFIAAQGELEGSGKLTRSKYERMKREADDTIATEGKNAEVLGKFHKGGKVKKTGAYRLLKGERVLNRKQAKRPAMKKAFKR